MGAQTRPQHLVRARRRGDELDAEDLGAVRFVPLLGAQDPRRRGAEAAAPTVVPGSAIRSDTVDELEVRWRAELSGGGALRTAPLVVGDEVLLQDGLMRIVRLDPTTGAERWASDPRGLNIGPFGVAHDGERAYGMDGATGVVAVDAVDAVDADDGDDGDEVWSTDITASDTTGWTSSRSWPTASCSPCRSR